MGNFNMALRVALGREPGAASVRKFGSNAAVGTSAETIWPAGGLVTYRSTAIAMQVSSDDANDDGTSSPLGTGAQTVEIFGLDANYWEINETVALNGTTQVETANTYLRVFRMIVRSAGSGGENAGIIYCGTGSPSPAGVPAVTHALISAGENQTELAFYTIPVGKTGVLCQYYLSESGAQALTGTIYARPLGQVFQNKFRSHQFNDPFPLDLTPVCDPFEEKTDIEMRAFVGASTAAVSGGFTLFLIDNVGS